MIPLPIPLRLISVHFLRLITTVPEGIAKELIMGLKYDLPGDGKPLQALIRRRCSVLMMPCARPLRMKRMPWIMKTGV